MRHCILVSFALSLVTIGLEGVIMNVTAEIEGLTVLGEKCGLQGKELLEFVCSEREKLKKDKERLDRDERVYQLELRRQEREKLELQAKYETAKRESVSSDSHTGARSKARAPKLPFFDENQDDLDAYLQRFERYATSQSWDTDEWSINLSALLKGKALDVYSRLSIDDVSNYEQLKDALLKRFHLTEYGFQVKFRTAKPEHGETAPQFAVRLDNLLCRWIDMAKSKQSYDGLKDLFIREQFLTSCNDELGTFLKERKPQTIQEMARYAEQYSEAHGGFNAHVTRQKHPQQPQRQQQQHASKPMQYMNSVPHKQPQRYDRPYAYNRPDSQQQDRTQGACYICHKTGHIARNCRSREARFNKIANVITSALVSVLNEDELNQTAQENSCGNQSEILNATETIACMITVTPATHKLSDCCTRDGMVKLECGHELPLMSAACRSTDVRCMPVTKGLVNGTTGTILRDSGCSGVVIRKDLVHSSQFTDQKRSCVLADGTISTLPVAIINLDTPYFTGRVEAVCMTKPVYDVLLGNIKGATNPGEPNLNWIPAKLKPSQTAAPIDQCYVHKSTVNTHNTKMKQINAVQTRLQKQAEGKPLKKLKVPEGLPEINKDELQNAQSEDLTLHRIRELANRSEERMNRYGTSLFLYQDGLIFREFHSPKVDHGDKCHQLVVPQKFRVHVLKLAHESILGGHQGPKKTTDKVLSNFFWPGIHSDILRFCRSCDICQRTISKGRVSKVPLGSMPIIDTPFQRIAMDIVGPIHPMTERGNRYILTLVDYATRYPEAVPLPSIETTRVAEAMMNIFSRVGIPNEVLTDQGAQFTSELMKEISRLLTIRQLTTTPYHPACNGLVERFNGTLKTMLKRLCADKPRDWDRYIAPLLFAYRETPQSSLGFAPFELLYGRTVRGPMTILKELWTGKVTNPETKTTYQYVLDLRERLEQTCELAQKELSKATENTKRYYNRKTRARAFKKDDFVLLLLPTDNNKLLLQWKGPFRVLEKVGNLDYKIDLNGKSKTFHANLLKIYTARTETEMQKPKTEIISNMLECATVSIIECEEPMSDSEIPHENIGLDNEELIMLPALKATETIDDVQIGTNLDSEQTNKVKRLLGNFRNIMTDLPGKTNLDEHSIKLSTSEPIRSKPYPLPYALQETVDSEVKQMLKMGIIQSSNSPYASPIVLIKKKDGGNRFCIDFRKINKITKFDAEPIPNQEQIFTKLSRDHYFTKLDLSKGYWQIPLQESDKPKTAFLTPNGLYHFNMMPFGLVNAPATFTRMMRSLLQGMQFVDNFIDDILIHTETWPSHIETLKELLKRLRSANLTAKPSKCVVGMEKVEFLGHIVGKGQLAPQEEKITKIKSAPLPKTKKQMRSFLGLAGYYRKFISNYAVKAAPLTDKTKNAEPNQIVWTDIAQKAFETLKTSLITAPILHLPDCDQPFVLRTDASDVGIGAVLLQERDCHLFPIAYASRKLLNREKAYCTMEKECLAVIWGVQKFQRYLYAKPFVLETDHQPLIYMQKTKVANARIMRWALSLQPYRIRIQAIKGSENIGADYLSRST